MNTINLSRNMLRVCRKAQMCVGLVMKKYRMTTAEEPFFMTVAHSDGITQEELTSLIGVDKAMTTRAVRSLEIKGFVQKVQDEHDKRQNRIYKTDKTDNIKDEVAQDLLHLNKVFTAGISEADLENVIRVLSVMEENISNYLLTEKENREKRN